MLIKSKLLIAGLLMVPVLALSAGFASTPVLAQGDFTIEGGVGSTKGEGVPEAIDGDDGFVAVQEHSARKGSGDSNYKTTIEETA